MNNLYIKSQPVIPNIEIPSYTQLEYIKTSPTQYIDTGILPSVNLVMEYTVQGNFTTAPTSSYYLFGRDYDYSSSGSIVHTYWSMYIYRNTLNRPYVYWNSSSLHSRAITNFSVADKHTYKFYNNGWDIDGVTQDTKTVFTSISRPNYCNTYPIFLNGYNYEGTQTSGQNFIIYGCKFYEGDKLIRDLVPARNNISNRIGLYDKITGAFLPIQDHTSSAESNFEAGPITNITLTPTIIPLKNIIGKTNCYINTGIKPTETLGVECLIDYIPSTTNTLSIFGSRYSTSATSTNQYGFNIINNQIRDDYNNNQNTIDYNNKQYFKVYKNKNITSIIGNDEITITHTATTFSTTTSRKKELYLLADNSDDTATNFANGVKVRWFKIYDNNVLKHYYIPVRVNNNNTLYDLVNNQIYFNNKFDISLFGYESYLNEEWTPLTQTYIKIQENNEEKWKKISTPFFFNQGIWIPNKSIPLNDCSWKYIKELASTGRAKTIFKVGDKKQILLNGQVGSNLSFNNSPYYCIILGFNHDGTTNTIDFGIGQNPEGIEIAFTSSYGSSKTDGTKIFNINHKGNYNYGGWAACDLRYDILGSTNIPPLNYGTTKTAECIGYNATMDCPISPVKNTLMAALPVDLRNILKPITIYTDNKGNKSNIEANITATIDYLPLLSEFEILGKRNIANIYEQNKQNQYEYFKQKTPIKYDHAKPTEDIIYYTRSQTYDDENEFVAIRTTGLTSVTTIVGYSRGLSPFFRI